jgi:hypothetical protein
MYSEHPSPALREAFAVRPFQGVAPEEARFIFIGLDANYDAKIETSPIYPQLLDYLKNGVAFWTKYKSHHPFLLPSYKGDGRRYHNTFASIGFTPEDSEDISFVELLHLPTYGRSNLAVEDLDTAHLMRLNDTILNGRAEFIFIPGSVGRLMRASKHFPWLPAQPTSGSSPLRTWLKSDTKTVYWHYHFSVYGKFEKDKQKQLAAITALRRGR